jgi:hypothetical protein
MVKGDRVEVLVDVGGSAAKRFEISARVTGSTVELSNVRGTVEVVGVTRSRTPDTHCPVHGFAGYRYRRAPGG